MGVIILVPKFPRQLLWHPPVFPSFRDAENWANSDNLLPCIFLSSFLLYAVFHAWYKSHAFVSYSLCVCLCHLLELLGTGDHSVFLSRISDLFFFLLVKTVSDDGHNLLSLSFSALKTRDFHPPPELPLWKEWSFHVFFFSFHFLTYILSDAAGHNLVFTRYGYGTTFSFFPFWGVSWKSNHGVFLSCIISVYPFSLRLSRLLLFVSSQ